MPDGLRGAGKDKVPISKEGNGDAGYGGQEVRYASRGHVNEMNAGVEHRIVHARRADAIDDVPDRLIGQDVSNARHGRES